MSTVIWFFDKLYVPRRLDFGVVFVVPLTVRETAFREAAEAYAALEGSELELSNRQLPEADVAAVSIRVEDVTDPDDAIAATSAQAHAVASAMAFRQMGRGRLLGVIAQVGGPNVGRITRAHYPRVTNLPVVSEEQELAAVVKAFADHPQAVVLADLFAEACRDQNPSASVTRLWAVLEGLAERLPGRKYDKVVAALRQLEIGEPMFDGKPLLRRAYGVRNDLMHRGRPAPVQEARRLQDDFAHLVAFALRQANLAPLVSDSARGR
jgi:hypothetical protein